MDDVMFPYHGASGPESSTALCLEVVHQVAVPDNYSVRLTSSEFCTGSEVYYL